MIKHILFGGFIFLSCSLPGSIFGQDTLEVMSYNMYHGEHYYERGKSNLREMANLINKIQPDLVALQEVDSLTGRSAALNSGTPVNQIEKLAKLTGMHGYFGKAIDFDGGGYGEGILSKHPLETKKVLLPIPKGGEVRALLVAKYPLNNGRFLRFGGTHLCHQFEDNRIAQVREINKFLSSTDQPTIIAGDFNFTPDEKPYKLFETNWLDAAVYSDNVAPTIPYHSPSKRIDYIFLSKDNWNVIEMKVLKENNSDHMPLVLKLIVE